MSADGWDPERGAENVGDLVAMAVHELRNSVMVVAEMARLAESQWDVADHLESRERVRIVVRHGARMQALLEDLLVVARLDAGSYRVEPRPVLVRDLLLEAAELDSQRRVTVVADPTVTVVADPLRLEQVVVNLVANACRHGEPPVVVEAPPPTGAVARITVRDHGPGVPASERPWLFAPFPPMRSTTSGDTGLGLHIAHRLTHLMDGELEYRPADPGAAFVVSLPAAATGPGPIDIRERVTP